MQRRLTNKDLYELKIERMEDLYFAEEDFSPLEKEMIKTFSTRIKELTNEKDAWKDKCEHDMSIHKRSNTTAVFLTIIAVVAAIAIGFIAGYAICINSSNDINMPTQNSIIAEQQYNQYESTQAATEIVTTQPSQGTQPVSSDVATGTTA